MAEVNWTPDTIFAARDHHVRIHDGSLMPVRLYEDGWTVGIWHSLDVWTACHILNDAQAVVPTVADLAAQGFYSAGKGDGDGA